MTGSGTLLREFLTCSVLPLRPWIGRAVPFCWTFRTTKEVLLNGAETGPILISFCKNSRITAADGPMRADLD